MIDGRKQPLVAVLTHLTSPYQVELFDAIKAAGGCLLDVFYLSATSLARSWRPRPINHPHVILPPAVDRNAQVRLAAADLVVFNCYDDPRVLPLMRTRARSGKPWCFWGERPGARQYGWLGQGYRRWRLDALRESDVPIWGIGRFAVDEYRREFGGHRPFANIPYFSDLARFSFTARSGRRRSGETTFLFSGALIPRKGVDLLAEAFLRLARTRSDVRLKLMGDGEMRAQLERTLEPVSDRVEFIGFRDWDDLPGEYQSADVLCVPSRYDGWGLVVPEGLASGLPVIGSDRTGAALELLRPRANGWLIPAADEDALFAAMSDAAVLKDDELAACSLAATASVGQHSLQDGAERFLAAAMQALEHWSVAVV